MEEEKIFVGGKTLFIWEWRDFVKEGHGKINENVLYEESNKRHSAMNIITNLKTFVQKYLRGY